MAYSLLFNYLCFFSTRSVLQPELWTLDYHPNRIGQPLPCRINDEQTANV